MRRDSKSKATLPILAIVFLGFLGGLLYVAPSIPNVSAAPTTVGTSTDAPGVTPSSNHNCFFDNTLWWCVWPNGSNVVYATSSTGASWSGTTTIRAEIAGENANYLGVEDNPTTHGFCYAYDADFITGTNTFWRCGKTSSGGSITFYSSEKTLTKTTFGAEGGNPNTSIQNDTAGNIWIYASTNNGNGEIWEITSNGASSTKQINCGHSQCGTTVAGPGQGIALKLNSGEMAFVYAASTSANNAVCVMTWSGSAFNTQKCSSTAYRTQNNGFSATTMSGTTVYMVAETTAAKQPVNWFNCAYPCTSYSTSETQMASESGGGWMNLASDNGSSGKLEVTYTNKVAPTTTINDNISSNSGSTWDSGHVLTSSETAIVLDIGSGSGYINSQGCIGIGWETGSGTVNFRFVTQDTCSSTVTQPVTATPRGSTAQQTVTVTGCVSTTFTGDGSSHNLASVTPTSTCTLTLPSGYHWQTSGTTTTTFTSCSSGTCTGFVRTYLPNRPVNTATKSCSVTTASSGTCTFAGNVPLNDTVIVGVVDSASTIGVSSITDGGSNTYAIVIANSLLSAAGDTEEWRAPVTTAGTLTVTVNFGSSISGRIIIYDLAGAASTIPDASIGSGLLATATAVASYTPVTNTFVIGVLNSACIGACTVTAGTSYTLDNNGGIGSLLQGSSESIVNSNTAETTPFNLGSASAYNEVSAAYLDFGQTETTVTLPLKVCLQSGATTGTFILDGANVSPTTISATAACSSYTSLTVDSSSSITIVVPTDGANAIYRFNSSSASAITAVVATCSSGTCGNKRLDAFYELQNNFKYQVLDGGSPTAPTLACNQANTSKTLLLTTSNQGFFCDYGVTATATDPLGTSTSTERWSNNSQSFTITASALTHSFGYYHQFKVTVSYSVSFGGSPTAPVFSGTQFGSGPTIVTLTGSPQANFFDATTTWTITNPTTGSTSTERWFTHATTSGTLNAVLTFAGVYAHQYAITFAVSPGGSGTTTPSGSNVFENATTLAILATPGAGYGFSLWSASSGSITFVSASSASTTATIGASGTITATQIVTSVTQPIRLTVANSGPSGTFTVSGCGITATNSTFTATSAGFTHTYSGLTPSCSVTVTAPAASTFTRYVFGGGASSVGEIFFTWSFNTCSSVSCSTKSNTTEYQVGNYYNFNPASPNKWVANTNGIAAIGFIGGASGQSVCSNNFVVGTGLTHCDQGGNIVFSDYNRLLTFGNITTTTFGKNWNPKAAFTFTPTTGNNNNTVNYYLQYKQSVEYSQTCHVGATCSTAPTLTFTSFGATGHTYTETKSNVTIWIDATTTATTSASITDSLSFVYGTFPTSWTINAKNTITFPIAYSIGGGAIVMSLKATITTSFSPYNTLSIDSSKSQAFSSTTGVITLTVTKGDLILVYVSNNPSQNPAILSTLTSPDFTFILRGSFIQNSPGGMNLWSEYAVDSSTTGSETITVVMSTSTAFTLTAISIKGANLITPFDPNVSLPSFNFQACNTFQGCGATGSTSNAQDMLIVGIGTAGNPALTVPSGFTKISSVDAPAYVASEFAYQLTSSTRSSISPQWPASINGIAVPLFDAIESASTIIAVSGCSTNSTALIGNGIVQHFQMSPGCSSVTLTMPSAAGGVRYFFTKGLNATETFTTPSVNGAHQYQYSAQFFITNHGGYTIVSINNGTAFTAIAGAGAWSDVNTNATLKGTLTEAIKVSSPIFTYQEPVNGYQLVTNESLGLPAPALSGTTYIFNATSGVYARFFAGSSSVTSVTITPSTTVAFSTPSSGWAYFANAAGIYNVVVGTAPPLPPSGTGSGGGTTCPPTCITSSSTGTPSTSNTGPTTVPVGPTNSAGQNWFSLYIFNGTNPQAGSYLIVIIFVFIFLYQRIERDATKAGKEAEKGLERIVVPAKDRRKESKREKDARKQERQRKDSRKPEKQKSDNR